MADSHINTSAEATVVAPKADQVAVLGNGDTTDASHNLLASLNDSHQGSMQRNTADSKTDTQAMQGDNDSIDLAAKTGALSQAVKAYIASGGDFSDAKGQALGRQFIGALRHQRDDNSSDRTTDQQYSGVNGQPGKDQKDAAAEAKVIDQDVAALASHKLTDAQTTVVSNDIASKVGLIQRELGDVPNEINYANHDTAANRAGANMEAVVRSAMHTHSGRTAHQLAGMIDAYHNDAGTGTLDTVVKDRKADLALEPGYIAANNADNANNNKAILEFTDPFKKH